MLSLNVSWRFGEPSELMGTRSVKYECTTDQELQTRAWRANGQLADAVAAFLSRVQRRVAGWRRDRRYDVIPKIWLRPSIRIYLMNILPNFTPIRFETTELRFFWRSTTTKNNKTSDLFLRATTPVHNGYRCLSVETLALHTTRWTYRTGSNGLL